MVAWLVALVTAIVLGPVRLPLAHLPALLVDPSGVGAASPLPAHELIVFWELRVPRALLATLVGAALGLCGALSQGLFRNPLAEPGLLGVTAGAILGTALSVVLFAPLFDLMPAWGRGLAMPLFGFATGLGATIIVWRLGRGGTRAGAVDILLAGIALNALMGALVGLLSFVASDAELRNLTFWTLGGLGQASWLRVICTLPFIAFSLLVGLRFARELDLYALGEDAAKHVGVDVIRLRRFVVVALAVGVGAAVTAAGLIGFVGLLVPHFVRLLVGPRHRSLLVLSTIFGAVLTLIADTLARTLAPPAEIPVGLLTSLVGAPVFLHLLLRRREAR